MEERRGSRFSRWIRVGARGREETAPAVLQLGVTLVVGIFVGIVILVAVLVWALSN